MFHNTDDIDDNELNEIFEACREALRKAANERIAKHKDGKRKEVGDIVLVWDASRLRNLETDEVNTDHFDHENLSRFPSIVIADNQKYNADIVLGEDRVYPCNLDLVIWNKTIGQKFRTCSEFVKITDKGV